MKKIFFISFLFCLFSFSQQQNDLDSLKMVLNNSKNNDIKSNILNKIYNQYLFINLDSAQKYKKQIENSPYKNKKEFVKRYESISKYYFYKHDIDSALICVKKALDIAITINDSELNSSLYRKLAILSGRNLNFIDAEKFGKLALENALLADDWHLIASSNIMLGNQYLQKNKFNIALKYYYKADSLYALHKIKDRFLALNYDNIANIYIKLKNAKALNYIKKSQKAYKDLDDIEGENYCFILKGLYYQGIKEYKKAIVNYKKALIFYENYGNIFRKTGLYNKLANCYSAINEYEKANRTLKKSEYLLKDSKNKLNLLELYLIQGQVALDQKMYHKSINYFLKSKNLLKNDKTGFKIEDLKDVNTGLSKAYFGSGNYKKAYQSNLLLIKINDSIFKKNNFKITQNLETKYQTDKKEQEIVLLKSQNELASQQKKNQRNLFLTSLMIISLIGLFFYFQYRNKQKTTKKLQELDKAKSNFFANISHEFRTPLTLISGPIQKQLSKENLKINERENFEMMHRNTNRLLSLVDQLLDISKMAFGNLKLNVAQNKIIPFVGTLIDGFSFMAKQKELNYVINHKSTELKTWFDKDFVEKIILNLVSNAIKYTPKSGSVICNSFVERKHFHFEIKNSGKGLTKQEMQKIFHRFYQTNEYQQGTGIGLSLAKDLVELHKGTITVESELDAWTTFRIKIPIDKNTFEDFEITTNITKADTFIKVNNENIDVFENELENNENPILLIVEDSTEVRSYVSSIFKNRYQILLAKNGQEGINLAIENIPDIIISDIMMPIKNGIELCNNLKTDERTSHIPIILLTAKAGDENILEGIKTGADDYITKPFNEELLKLKTNNLLEIRKKLQERFSQEVILKPVDIAINSTEELFLEKLQKVLDDQLIESDFNSEKFCNAIGVSRMQLHRKLKALFNMSTSEFIRTQRLKLAADLLKKSDINISQIGYSVGFNDHAYFSKRFKELFGCSPLEYSKK